MKNNGREQMKQFFDSLAPHWDEEEVIPEARRDGLLQQLGIQKGENVLDIACGTGVITGSLYKLTDTPVIGIDLSDEMILRAKKKYEGVKDISLIEGDFLTYPFEDSSFDFAVIYNAYPHFLEPKKLSIALARVLKKGGHFAVLHSLGRDQLSICHKHTGSLSRVLQEPKEESKYFMDFFRIQKAEEGKVFYFILGEKK